MIKLVFVDFSGTLAESSGCNTGGRFLGRGKKHEQLWPLYVEGKITVEEILSETFSEWNGLKTSDLQQIVAKINFLPGSKEALSALSDMGIQTVLLSNIPTQLGRLVAERYGLDMYSGNVLEVIEGLFTGQVLEYHNDKVTEVKRILEEKGILPSEAVMIGDGKDDARVMDMLAFGISYRGGKQAVLASKYQIDDWSEVSGIFQNEQT